MISLRIKKRHMQVNKESKKSKNNKKSSFLWFVPEIACICFVLIAVAALYYFYDIRLDAAIERSVFSVIIISVLGFSIRRNFPVVRHLEKRAVSNLGRFWACFAIGLVFSVVSVFIPSAAWPFTGFFVVLSLFSNPFLGMLGGSSLVIIATVLTGCKAGITVLYLIGGSLGVAAFFPLRDDLKIWRPLFLTLLGLFTCEMTGIILSSSSQISPEQFLLPGLNLIITGIIIFAGVRIYALKVKYSLRDRYQILNDTEYYLLADARENDKSAYKHIIHTSYFTERIARKLGMDTEALKCAGYYYRFCPLDEKERQEFFDAEEFPGRVTEILTEYTDFIAKRTGNKLRTRECGVLLFSHTIILAVIALYEKNPDIQISDKIDKLVDATFSRYEKGGVFSDSNLTLNDVNTMMKIFKEEKLYYELLR
ncbi:MAG: hypothetical protein IJ796_09720 [Lachnospiraceae bacterium]|nr:hypothetical protein [Lachnospiraceae bacterium]